MKKNLAVYVLYHSQFEYGKSTYGDIYKLLCRDANHPFEDGLDIPVYLRTGDDEQMHDIKPISLDNTDRTFVLVLVDDKMYCSDVWKKYLGGVVALEHNNPDKVQIVCVELSKYAFDIGHDLSDKQFIRLKSFSIQDNWKEFQTRLFDNIIRFILGRELTKLKIFISHSKKDENKIGLKCAIKFRDHIRSKTKLDSFFDGSDILDGQDFENQIRNNVAGELSLLVILNSNTYSEREWCQKEVLLAKKNKIPTIAVSLLDGEVKRSFPYISNIPYIRFNDNWDDVLILILRTALDQYSQAQYLANIHEEMDEPDRNTFQTLPFSPEAYSYVYEELASNIIYPEPPLTKDELDILKKIAGKEKQFLTPMQLLAQTVNLKGKNVAISVSEAPDSDVLGYGTEMIRDLTIELSRHLLIAGARMIYGGDLRKDGYTELFCDLSLQYKDYQGTVDRETFFFQNYFAWPIYLNFTNETKLQYVNSRVKPIFVDCPEEYWGDKNKPISPVNNENNYAFALSLLKMRKQMEAETDARVILGGRTSGFSGFMAGVIEEFVQAVMAGHPVYLLGGFGGAASLLASLIKNEKRIEDVIKKACEAPRYADFMNFCGEKKFDMGYDKLKEIMSKGFDCLNNGLSNEQNAILMQSTDVIEIVGLIINGLKNKIGHA
jgi:hypothetical protein